MSMSLVAILLHLRYSYISGMENFYIFEFFLSQKRTMLYILSFVWLMSFFLMNFIFEIAQTTSTKTPSPVIQFDNFIEK